MALFTCYCVEIKLLLSGKKKKKGHTRGKRNCIKSAQVKLCTFTSPSQRCHGFPPARCWSQTLAMFGALIVHLGGFFTYSYHYLRFNDQAQWFVFIGLHRHAHTCISGAFPFGNDTRKNNLTLIGSSCQACSCIKHFLLLTLKKKKKKCLFFLENGTRLERIASWMRLHIFGVDVFRSSLQSDVCLIFAVTHHRAEKSLLIPNILATQLSSKNSHSNTSNSVSNPDCLCAPPI